MTQQKLAQKFMSKITPKFTNLEINALELFTPNNQ